MLIRNVRVFDGERSCRRRRTCSSPTGGSRGRAAVSGTRGAGTIDGTGKTLLPGLIDGHTHTWGTRWRARSSSASPPSSTCSPTPHRRPDARGAGEAGRPRTGPTSARPALSPPRRSGHGTEYGMTIPTLTKPEEAQAWVDARIAEGSDYIKIVSRTAPPTACKIPTLDRATIAAVVDAAHERRQARGRPHRHRRPARRRRSRRARTGSSTSSPTARRSRASRRCVQQHKAFVTPTLTVVESTTGTASGKALPDDPRTRAVPARPTRSATSRQSFPSATAASTSRTRSAAVRQLASGGRADPRRHRRAEPRHGARREHPPRARAAGVRPGSRPTEALAAATSIPARTSASRTAGASRRACAPTSCW